MSIKSPVPRDDPINLSQMIILQIPGEHFAGTKVNCSLRALERNIFTEHIGTGFRQTETKQPVKIKSFVLHRKIFVFRLMLKVSESKTNIVILVFTTYLF